MDRIKQVNKVMVSLFNIVLKQEERAIKESFAHELSVREMHTLDAIGIGRERTMSEVASSLNIQLSTLTTAMNKLVKKGYVERFRIPSDRRIVKVKLTDQGEAAVINHEAFHEDMIATALGKLSSSEVDTFLESLNNINRFMHMQMATPKKKPEDFKLEPLTIGKHRLEKNLFQGGMSVGISGAKLATAVSKEGGLGVISAIGIGYREEDYEENSLEADLRCLRREIKKVREEIPQAIFGVNIPYSIKHYEEYVKASIEEGSKVIISGAGLPMMLPSYASSKDVALIPVISSERAAQVIMKKWKKKYDRLPEGFIFENAFSGGQLGYKESQIEMAKMEYYMTIGKIKDAIGDIPLIVGGGIFSREDGENAYVFGADGIQIGSRFVTTFECDGDEKYKECYLNCKEKDVTIIKTPGGMPCRVLRNSFTESLEENSEYDVTKALIEGSKGNMKEGLVLCGSKAYRQNRMERVSDIFAEFM